MAKKKYDLGNILNELKKSESNNDSSENSGASEFYKVGLEKDQDSLEVVLRFLPNPDSENQVPWVYRPAHMIKFANGKFMYAPCPKKVKKGECPICEEVNLMYKSQDPAQEAQAGKQFAKKRYFHNILVVKDPRNNGENEGKVLIWEYGKQVHDKCLEALQDEDDPLVYFDPEDGANFKLKIVRNGDFPNYDKSKFMKPSALEVDGEELDEDEADAFIEENCHKLNEKLMGDASFKSYEELRSLYDNQGVVKKVTKAATTEDDEDDDEEIIARAAKKKSKAKAPAKTEEPPFDTDEEAEDQDDYSADTEEDEDEDLMALLEDDD